MLRVKALLLLAVTSVVFAGCGGVSEAETTNGAGTTPPTDTTPPSTPTGLTGAAAGSTGANLSWIASTDNVGVAAYILLRNGGQMATPATTGWTSVGLGKGADLGGPGVVKKTAGNVSPYSTTVGGTTPSGAGTTP